jgi:hypothetical protein
MEERRTAERQTAYISAELETATGRSTIAITRDISPTGVLVMTRIQPELGEPVTLTVHLEGSTYALVGKVVRVETMEPHEIWRRKVALTFEGPNPALASLRAAFA